MRVGRVPLVAAPHVVGRHVDRDPVRSACRRSRAHPRIGDEPDLELCVRSDDDTDVASLDHRVALLAERALPLAHDLAHLGMAGDDGDGRVDHAAP